jgi:hypothetical protein
MGAGILSPACDSSHAPELVVADSAGVRLVRLSWDDTPIDTVDGAADLIVGDGQAFDSLEFFGIRHVSLARDSAILVADRGQRIIRIDLRTGAVLRLGRSGDGPLEFRGLARVLPMQSGNILAVDARRRRIVEVAASGELVREVPFPEVATAGGTLLVLPAGPVSFETLHVAAIPGFENSDGRAHRGFGAVLRLAEPAETLAVFRGPTTFAGRGATGAVVFGANTLFAGSADGLWLGDTAEPRVELWTPGQGLAAVVRWLSQDARVVSADREAEFWSRVESGMPPDQRAALAEMKRTLPFADSIPAFGSLIAAPPYVWIGRAHAPEVMALDLPTPPQEWLVVDYRTGSARRILTPASFTLTGATESFILGVHRDALGIETLRRYRLPRQSPSGG